LTGSFHTNVIQGRSNDMSCSMSVRDSSAGAIDTIPP